MSRKQTPESFWAKVHKGKRNECWEWQGSRNNTGYGTVGWHGVNYTAHRVAAWLDGLVDSPYAPKGSREKTHVLHKCDNRKCCNPHHFFLGNYRDNQKDAYDKKRREQPKGEAHTNAKLTDAQAKAIRRSYENGMTQMQLAAIYGVSQVTISLIVRGKTYKCKY